MTLNQVYYALIVDCDGVLVNSESIYQRVELEHLAHLGLSFSRDDFMVRFSGLTTTEFIDRMNEESLSRLQKPLPPSFRNQLDAAKGIAIERELSSVPGAREFLISWKKPKAVASSSTGAGLKLKLNQTNLLDLFDGHVYSAESVERGKPDPAIFEFAAKKLDVDSKHCLVVEDSVLGVRAAKAANMNVVGFVGGDHCIEDHDQALVSAGADFVVSEFGKLRDALGI